MYPSNRWDMVACLAGSWSLTLSLHALPLQAPGLAAPLPASSHPSQKTDRSMVMAPTLQKLPGLGMVSALPVPRARCVAGRQAQPKIWNSAVIRGCSSSPQVRCCLTLLTCAGRSLYGLCCTITRSYTTFNWLKFQLPASFVTLICSSIRPTPDLLVYCSVETCYSPPFCVIHKPQESQ